MKIVRNLEFQDFIFAFTEAPELKGTWGELIYFNNPITSFPSVIHPFLPAVFILYSFHPSVLH